MFVSGAILPTATLPQVKLLNFRPATGKLAKARLPKAKTHTQQYAYAYVYMYNPIMWLLIHVSIKTLCSAKLTKINVFLQVLRNKMVLTYHFEGSVTVFELFGVVGKAYIIYLNSTLM